jgi:hypothetical protein
MQNPSGSDFGTKKLGIEEIGRELMPWKIYFIQVSSSGWRN